MVCLALCGVLSSCSSPEAPVVKIKLATVPVGDTADALSDPVHEKLSRRFTWNVETRLDPTPYLEWVADRLSRQGFTVHDQQERSLTLAKLDEGDAYGMHLEVTHVHPTRVRVTLTASPG